LITSSNQKMGDSISKLNWITYICQVWLRKTHEKIKNLREKFRVENMYLKVQARFKSSSRTSDQQQRHMRVRILLLVIP